MRITVTHLVVLVVLATLFSLVLIATDASKSIHFGAGAGCSVMALDIAAWIIRRKEQA